MDNENQENQYPQKLTPNVIVSQNRNLRRWERPGPVLVLITIVVAATSFALGYFLDWPGIILACLLALGVALVAVVYYSLNLGYFVATIILLLLLSLAASWLGRAAIPVPVLPPNPEVDRVYYWQSSSDNGISFRTNFDLGRSLRTKTPPTPGSAFLFDATAAPDSFVRELRSAYFVCSSGAAGFARAAKVPWPPKQKRFLDVVNPDLIVEKKLGEIIAPPYPKKTWCAFGRAGKRLAVLTVASQGSYGYGGLDPAKIRALGSQGRSNPGQNRRFQRNNPTGFGS